MFRYFFIHSYTYSFIHLQYIVMCCRYIAIKYFHGELFIIFLTYWLIQSFIVARNAEGVVENMIRVCRPYFPLGATREILQEVEPLLCPFDMTMQRAMVYLELFLPTTLTSEQDTQGWKLWHQQLLGQHFISFYVYFIFIQ